MRDEKAIIFKVQYLYGARGRKYDGHKREGRCALPGKLCQSAQCYRHREVMKRVGRSQQRPGKDTSTVSEGRT